MNNSPSPLLSQVSFNIMFALSLKPRHGYELMQQIKEDSNGKVRLGPGALYGGLKSLRSVNLIEEMPFAGNERRRYYRLTKKGWDRLEAEISYFETIVRLARTRHIRTDT